LRSMHYGEKFYSIRGKMAAVRPSFCA
jgi:hypothetical protein